LSFCFSVVFFLPSEIFFLAATPMVFPFLLVVNFVFLLFLFRIVVSIAAIGVGEEQRGVGECFAQFYAKRVFTLSHSATVILRLNGSQRKTSRNGDRQSSRGPDGKHFNEGLGEDKGTTKRIG